MKQEIISLNSDTINRYNIVFPITVLEDGIKDTYETGMPMCIGHDRHRPIGVTFPFALYLEPHISRLLGKKITGESEEDFREINKLHENYLQRNYYEGFTPHQEKFLNIVGEYLSVNHTRMVAGCAAVFDKDISIKIFPDLFAQKDDAGLIPLSVILTDFTYQGQGIFKHRTINLSIYAHHNFRRAQSVHNNFHFYFLNELLAIADNPDITIKLCIDEDIIGYAPSYHESMELEYHWGPKFTDDISSIKLGITRHECDKFEKAYSGISSTEFYWKSDEAEKTFEMEELKDEPAPNLDTETYNCRYMHSIYNTDSKSFTHFDGAIRSYGFEEMNERLGKNFVQYGRKAAYKKLFRIDGKLPLEKWKLLLVHYMQDNPLVYEYFNLSEERNQLKIQPVEISKEKQLIPFAIKKETGLRLLISYHKVPENSKLGRYIDIYDIIGTETETFNCAEHLVLELKKSLQRIGEDLEIAPDTKYLKVLDRYWNIPSVMHNGPDPEALLQKTVEAYKAVFKAIKDKGHDMDIAFTLGVIINNRLVRISCYGNIETLFEWMENHLSFPVEEKQFSKWVEKQRKYLQTFPESSDDPLITSLVQSDGVLYIKRRHVKYPYKFKEDERGLVYSIEFPEKNDEVLTLVEKEKVEPKMLMIVTEMKWEDTNEDYFTSPRSKWLDENNGAGVLITGCEPLGLYWSKS